MTTSVTHLCILWCKVRSHSNVNAKSHIYTASTEWSNKKVFVLFYFPSRSLGLYLCILMFTTFKISWRKRPKVYWWTKENNNIIEVNTFFLGHTVYFASLHPAWAPCQLESTTRKKLLQNSSPNVIISRLKL